MSRRVVGACLLTVAIASACGKDDPNALTSDDAGAPDAPKPVQPTDARPDDGRPRDAARESTAPRGGGSEEPAPECDAGDLPIVTDAAAPPVECVPPCLWELWKHCPPPGYMGTPDYRLTTVRHDGPHIYEWSESVYANGCLCYTISHTNIPPSLMMPTTFWNGPNGRQVVRLDNDPSLVNCGGVARYDPYTINLDLPECAPWRSYYY